MARIRRGKINRLLAVILAGMIALLIFDEKAAAVDYLQWQWHESDKLAGYLKKIALDTGNETLLGSVFPGFGYAEKQYLGIESVHDPSYTEYLDTFLASQTELEQYGEEDSRQQESVTEPAVEETQLQEVSQNTIGAVFNREALLDFAQLLKNNYTVTSITELRPETFDVEAALDMDMTLGQDNTKPQILIFHTHSQEGFVDSVEGEPSTMITGVGEYLAEILRNQYGYQVIHDTSVYDLIDGKLDRSKAYTYAEKGVEKILEQYPSIEVIIDLHRDGVDERNHLVTEINGRPAAKIMFFNGISYTKVNGELDYLPNPYIEENLAMSLQLKLLGDQYYPGFLRKNYIHGYRYCLHYRAKSMLIEAGAQNNTLQEELNAMEPLAEILHRLLSGEKAYK